MFSFFFYSEPVIREYAHVHVHVHAHVCYEIHTAPTEYLYYQSVVMLSFKDHRGAELLHSRTPA